MWSLGMVTGWGLNDVISALGSRCGCCWAWSLGGALNDVISGQLCLKLSSLLYLRT